MEVEKEGSRFETPSLIFGMADPGASRNVDVIIFDLCILLRASLKKVALISGASLAEVIHSKAAYYVS